MSKSEKQMFLNIIDWLYSINTGFGVHHVCILGKTYWLDTESDREALYKLWEESK